MSHANNGDVVPVIEQFLEKKYPHYEVFGYKFGDLRGGLCIIISI
jgi:hypothetical protein